MTRAGEFCIEKYSAFPNKSIAAEQEHAVENEHNAQALQSNC
jgi:hypothetical protein